MPAEIVTMADCQSCFGVYKVTGSKGDTYTVAMHGESGVHCTCEGFKYRQDCKHIKYVWENACMWNPQWNDGNPSPKLEPEGFTYDAVVSGETCPNCHGPVVAVRRAV